MEEKNHKYSLRRFRCKLCDKVHHELPSCLLPKKRYETEIYEHVIVGQTDGMKCEEKTITKIQQWGETLLQQYVMMIDPLYQNTICGGTCPERCIALLQRTNLPDKGWMYFLIRQLN